MLASFSQLKNVSSIITGTYIQHIHTSWREKNAWHLRPVMEPCYTYSGLHLGGSFFASMNFCIVLTQYARCMARSSCKPIAFHTFLHLTFDAILKVCHTTVQTVTYGPKNRKNLKSWEILSPNDPKVLIFLGFWDSSFGPEGIHCPRAFSISYQRSCPRVFLKSVTRNTLPRNNGKIKKMLQLPRFSL